MSERAKSESEWQGVAPIRVFANSAAFVGMIFVVAWAALLPGIVVPAIVIVVCPYAYLITSGWLLPARTLESRRRKREVLPVKVVIIAFGARLVLTAIGVL